MYDVNLQHFEHIDSIAIKGGLLGGHQVRRFGAMEVCYYEVFLRGRIDTLHRSTDSD